MNTKGVFLSVALTLGMTSSAWALKDVPCTYPKTESVNNVDVYHGVSIKDPYRWLEDTNSSQTHDWVLKENAVTRGYLDKIPARKAIAKRLKELWNYGRCGLPTKEGQLLFYTKNNGLQNQDVLFVQEGTKGKARVLLDPNTLSKDGTVNLSSYDISKGGGLIAYGLSSSGSDWEDWYFKNVSSGENLPDHLKWLKNAHAVWAPDGQGVYYTRYDEPEKVGDKFLEANYFQKVFYHRLGTEQSADTLVFERKDQKEWNFDPVVTDDGKYLLIVVTHGTSPKNGVFVKDLSVADSKIVEFFQPGTAMMNPIGNDGNKFYFMSDEDAPTAKIVAVEANFAGDQVKFEKRNLIKAGDDTLESASYIGGKFLCQYLHNACSSVSVFDRDGKLTTQLNLPGLGTVHGFSGRQNDNETFFTYTSFTAPSTVYHLDLSTNAETVFFQPKVNGFNQNDYVTEQIFCTSKDGTKVPVFVSHRKNVAMTGNTPTYLYGYGGFKISMLPAFSNSNLLWMERGGTYAVAILRGGGEFGEQWHAAGMKVHKQRVFDDFIAAAQGLIEKGYTSSQKLAIGGGSNGGLLVGACITQQPALYGAAVAAVGVMDMLRFNQFTVGWEWEQEYGSPKNEDEFKALYAYSPLHNIKSGICYPATLITTADHDDRVVPGHSFKFAAALQAAQSCDRPTLIRIDTKAGHGHGKSTAKLIEEATDKWAFLTSVLKVEQTNIASK